MLQPRVLLATMNSTLHTYCMKKINFNNYLSFVFHNPKSLHKIQNRLLRELQNKEKSVNGFNLELAKQNAMLLSWHVNLS